MGYSVQKIGLQAGIAKLTVTFDGTPAIATNEKMKISLFITGTIDYSISISDGAPMTANGTLTSRVHANYRNIREQPMDVDWCRGTNVFSYERVLIPFTEEEIFPLHWKPRDDTLRGNPTVRP